MSLAPKEQTNSDYREGFDAGLEEGARRAASGGARVVGIRPEVMALTSLASHAANILEDAGQTLMADRLHGAVQLVVRSAGAPDDALNEQFPNFSAATPTCAPCNEQCEPNGCIDCPVDNGPKMDVPKPLPKEPPPNLLMSMAIRYDHGLGCPGYYDAVTEKPGEHARRLESTLRTMRQLYEEVSGHGFYSASWQPPIPADSAPEEHHP